MQIIIEKTELLRVLSLPVSASDKKTTIPILSNVLLQVGEALRITGTNLELGVHHTTSNLSIKKGGAVTVPAKRLLDLIRALPGGDVEITTGDNHWVTVKCGRSKSRIAGMSSDSFPEVPTVAPAAAFTVPMANLVRMIKCTQMAISQEESRFTLSGALLEIESDEAKMVTTDGHRMAILCGKVEAEAKVPNNLVPAYALRALAGITGAETVSVSFDDNHLYFAVGDLLIVARKMAGNFPDYRRVLPNGTHQNTVTVNREELEAGLRRVGQFADERSRAVRMTFCPGEIKISAASVETGESEESVPADGVLIGEPIEIGLNCTYLLDLIAVLEDETLTFNLADAKSAALIKHGDGGMMIIMPMRF